MWPHVVWFFHEVGYVLHVVLTAQESVFVILVLTCGAIFWQAWETRKAAEAARDNILALVDSERAWLLPGDSIEPKILPTARLSPIQTVPLVVKVQNYGRTPAWLMDWTLEVSVLEDTNIQQFTRGQIPEEDFPNARPLPPKENFTIECEWKIGTPSEIDDVQSGKKHLYVYGYIAYRSTVGKDSCQSYFCFHYYRRRDNEGNFKDGWAMEPPEENRYT